MTEKVMKGTGGPLTGGAYIGGGLGPGYQGRSKEPARTPRAKKKKNPWSSQNRKRKK
jgi:hypothetical protein